MKTQNFKKTEDQNVSQARGVAKKLVSVVDPHIGYKISRYLADRNPAPATLELSSEEVGTIKTEIKALAECPVPSDREIRRVEIIVLKYKDPEVETICASRIIENTQWPYKLNFFDNRPGTKNMSKIWNRLIRESICDYIVIMDSDVFVPNLSPCWLTRLMGTFDEFDNCYVVSPKVTKTSGVQQKADKMRKGDPEKISADFAGMCVLYKKEVFEKVGYFDEEFLLYGSDVEWSRRFINSGLSGNIRPDVLVDHVGHYSTSKAAKLDPQVARWSAVEKIIALELLENKRVKNNTQPTYE